MHHFLDGVKEIWLVGDLWDKLHQDVVNSLIIDSSQGNVVVRDQVTIGVEAEGICKWPVFVDMKTFERFVGVKVVARKYPAVREEKVDLGWNLALQEVANDSDEYKGDSHERTVGVQCPGDNN